MLTFAGYNKFSAKFRREPAKKSGLGNSGAFSGKTFKTCQSIIKSKFRENASRDGTIEVLGRTFKNDFSAPTPVNSQTSAQKSPMCSIDHR